MFSVVIPTFNDGCSLKKSIHSVLNQTFQDFELIIVDNGSSDDTSNLVRRIQKKYQNHKIRYFFQDNSGSPAGSRNTGIKNANRDWISFLDADDYWLPKKLEETKNRLFGITKDVVALSHWEYVEKLNIKSKVKRLGQNRVINQYQDLLFNGNCYSTSAMTVRRSTITSIGGFNCSPSYFGVEDYMMWLSLARSGKIITIKKPLSVFCLHDTNFSGNVKALYDNEKNLLKYEINKRFSGDKHLLNKHLARIDYYVGRALQKKGDQSSVSILLNSIKAYPFAFKKYVALLLALFGIKH